MFFLLSVINQTWHQIHTKIQFGHSSISSTIRSWSELFSSLAAHQGETFHFLFIWLSFDIYRYAFRRLNFENRTLKLKIIISDPANNFIFAPIQIFLFTFTQKWIINLSVGSHLKFLFIQFIFIHFAVGFLWFIISNYFTCLKNENLKFMEHKERIWVQFLTYILLIYFVCLLLF